MDAPLSRSEGQLEAAYNALCTMEKMVVAIVKSPSEPKARRRAARSFVSSARMSLPPVRRHPAVPATAMGSRG